MRLILASIVVGLATHCAQDENSRTSAEEASEAASLSIEAGKPTSLFGDLNGNGLLQSNDTTILQRYVSGVMTLEPWQLAIADMNLDGKIDDKDVVLLRAAVGQIVKLPAKMGDINGNGALQSNDTSLLERHISAEAQLEPWQLALADLNLDNKIDAKDVELLRAAIGQKVKSLPIKYGDINANGILQSNDTTLLQRHVSGIVSLEPWQLALADLNLDEKIDDKDVEVLRAAITGQVKVLPAIGDIDGSGALQSKDTSLLQDYLAGSMRLEPWQLALADLNLDNKIDSKDIELLRGAIGQAVKSLPVRYGDINGNGILQSDDTTTLQRHLSGAIRLEPWQLAVADLNLDGKVDSKDLELLRAGIGQLVKLPAKLGDLNGNGALQSNDTTLLRRHLSNATKLEPWQLALADLNLDNQIDEKDVDALREKIGGSGD